MFQLNLFTFCFFRFKFINTLLVTKKNNINNNKMFKLNIKLLFIEFSLVSITL